MNEYPNVFRKVWSLDEFIRSHGFICNEEWKQRRKVNGMFRVVTFDDGIKVITAHQLDSLPVIELIANSSNINVGNFKDGGCCMFRTWVDPTEWEAVDLDSKYYSYTLGITYKRKWEPIEQDILSHYYTSPIDEHYSFVYQNHGFGLGLLKDGREVIPCVYDYITRPLDGWCFAIRKYPFVPGLKEWDNYYVILCDVERYSYNWIEPKNILVAIDSFHKDNLEIVLSYGGLRLFKTGKDRNNLKSYTIRTNYSSLFLPSFLDLIDVPIFVNNYKPTTYWLSVEDAYEETHKKGLYSLEDTSSDDYDLINDGLDGEASAYWGLLD